MFSNLAPIVQQETLLKMNTTSHSKQGLTPITGRYSVKNKALHGHHSILWLLRNCLRILVNVKMCSWPLYICGCLIARLSFREQFVSIIEKMFWLRRSLNDKMTQRLILRTTPYVRIEKALRYQYAVWHDSVPRRSPDKRKGARHFKKNSFCLLVELIGDEQEPCINWPGKCLSFSFALALDSHWKECLVSCLSLPEDLESISRK